ncbi:MAG: sulfotransferase [Chloroflexi bacterium]|nr:sulfotransferase [Chloroflexota bacterium]
MIRTLVRVNSTGRSGTKFLAELFADQGYRAFHENLYAGEPSSAIIEYQKMLGNAWLHDRAWYYDHHSNFPVPYYRSVLALFEPTQSIAPRWKIWARRAAQPLPADTVIDTGNTLTASTPEIDAYFTARGFALRYLILFRNPLKTIHAYYQVEGSTNYSNRPSTFSAAPDDPVRGAALLWKHFYAMMLDQRARLGPERFRLVALEEFTRDLDYVQGVFDFLGLTLDRTRAADFLDRVNNAPLRSAKVDDARNSDIFHNPEFSFSEEDIERIRPIVAETTAQLGVDLEQAAADYRAFHAEQKARLGFRQP